MKRKSTLTYADWVDGFVTACVEKDYPGVYAWEARAAELNRFDHARMRIAMTRVVLVWDLRKAWRRLTGQLPSNRGT